MEQASCLGGTHSAYSSLGTAQKDQENQAIAGLEQSVFSTQIGDTNQNMVGGLTDFTTLAKDKDNQKHYTPGTGGHNIVFSGYLAPEESGFLSDDSGYFGDSGSIGYTGGDADGEYMLPDDNPPSKGGGSPTRPFNRNPYRNISYHKSIDPALGNQITDLLNKSPELRGILSPFIKGGGKLRFEIDPNITNPNVLMDTRMSNGDLIISINPTHVDANGFHGVYTNGSKDNVGYIHDGTIKSTFAVAIAHEAIHAKHVHVYAEAMETTQHMPAVAREYLLSKGYSIDFANIFFTYENGAWRKANHNEIDEREHAYISKYNHEVLDRVKGQYRGGF
ncbi:MAG: hypothetical protein Q4A44_00560 [Bacteroidales bacterium]|nr:hypothetical protein [Bacteroidales bacterium]